MLASLLVTANVKALDPESITQADLATLLEDASLLNEIGKGVALSIAKCEGRSPCKAIISTYEIEEMMEVLDERIEGVESRQQESEEDLTAIVTAYIDVKARYADYLSQFSQIVVYEPVQAVEEKYDIFVDSDEGLEDEGEFEFEELPLEDDGDDTEGL